MMANQPPTRPWFMIPTVVRPLPPPRPRPPTSIAAPVPVQTVRPTPVAPPQPTQLIPPAPPADTATTLVATPTTPAPISPATSPSPAPPVPRSLATTAVTPTSPPKLNQPTSAPSSPVIKTYSSLTASPGKSGHPSPAPSSPVVKTSPSRPASPQMKSSPAPKTGVPDAKSASLTTSPTPAFKSLPSSPVPPPPSPVSPTTGPIAAVSDYDAFAIPETKTPPRSPKDKTFLAPPSPLTLPPALIRTGNNLVPLPAEVKQKTVLTQETTTSSARIPKSSNGQQQHYPGVVPNDSMIKDGKPELNKGEGVQKKSSEDLGISFVTLAGENRGAIMELGSSSLRQGKILESSLQLKERKDQKQGDKRAMIGNVVKSQMGTHLRPMDAFINSNVQGMNNSIVYSSSCTHNDPGVHLTLTRKGDGGREMVHFNENLSG